MQKNTNTWHVILAAVDAILIAVVVLLVALVAVGAIILAAAVSGCNIQLRF